VRYGDGGFRNNSPDLRACEAGDAGSAGCQNQGRMTTTDSVWLSLAPQKSESVSYYKRDRPVEPPADGSSYRAIHRGGGHLDPTVLPQPAIDVEHRKTKLGHLFFVNGLLCVTDKGASVLRQFDLGTGALSTGPRPSRRGDARIRVLLGAELRGEEERACDGGKPCGRWPVWKRQLRTKALCKGRRLRRDPRRAKGG
jgi:hypothetical protein